MMSITRDQIALALVFSEYQRRGCMVDDLIEQNDALQKENADLKNNIAASGSVAGSIQQPPITYRSAPVRDSTTMRLARWRAGWCFGYGILREIFSV